MPFVATWMDLEIIFLSDVNQLEKGKSYGNDYMWNLIKKMIQMNLFTNKIDSQILKSNLQLPKGKHGGK